MRTTKYNHIYIVEFILKWPNLLHTLGEFDASIFGFYIHLLIPPIAQDIDSNVSTICRPGQPIWIIGLSHMMYLITRIIQHINIGNSYQASDKKKSRVRHDLSRLQ